MTAADFLNKFPEFKAVDEARIELSLDEAKLQVTEKIWGRFYEVGVLHLAAHILAMQGALSAEATNSSQPLREIGSKAVGSLSVSYTSSKTGFESESGSYYLTKYGQRYLELKRLVTPHFGLVR
nr:MAG TPA: head to tail adaptor [Caudoviricetes sp.]